MYGPAGMQTMRDLALSLELVRARIRAAAIAAGRDPAGIALVAVSKTFPAADVLAALAGGQRDFGENYVQEALAKMDAVAAALVQQGASAAQPQWHFTGPIQSNKTRAIAQRFDWVHGVDRLKTAQRLSEARPPERAPLQVCIQVNVGGEASKGGVAPEDAEALAVEIGRLPRLRLRGLMTIPRPTDDVSAQRSQFRVLRELRERLSLNGLSLDTLSMGMSDDLEAAIAEGATMVRIGRAIFGNRSLHDPV
jgi:pyridoxal phosphate enzyme (YggS family)